MFYAGTAVSAFVEDLLVRLVDEKKSFLSSAIQSKVNILQETLFMILPLLNDASHKQLTDKAVGVWLYELQHLCYDLDDALDDVATKGMERQLAQKSKSKLIASKVSKLIPTNFSLTNTLNPKFDSITTRLQSLHRKLDFITLRLQSLEREISVLGLKNIKLKDTSSRRNETSLLEGDVVGREGEKEKLLNELLRDDPSHKNFSFLGIVGMGGLGKTTLATLLYDELVVKDHFELMAWVTVSDVFDVFEISNAIFRSLTNVDQEFKYLNQLQMALSEKLRDKRFLLVLDDVRNENIDVWEELVLPFHSVARGSKIIITTRKEHLLKKLGSNHIGHLQTLSDEDSLSLLALHALGVDNFDSYPTLRKQGEGIVKKCGGFPLALKTIGSLLKTKEYGEGWDDVLNSEIWYSPMDSVLSALELSYNDLPAHLKPLFAYCSLFPKGFLFDKKNLVLLWLAEGYLNQSHANEFNESPERLGLYYFDTLLSRSLFQQAPYHKSLFVMHDLMHDLAMSVAGNCFLRFDKPMRMVDKAFAKCRHMSFAREKYAGYKQFEAFKRAESLRTLIAVSVELDTLCNFIYLPNKILADVLPHIQLLRVLSLSNCNICEVPDFIGSMKHLRYLNLSQTKIKELPENVGNLYYLQSLLVFRCRRLTKLPKSFLNLKKLRHFDMRETPLLKNMPLGISELKNLQTLSKIIIGGDNGFEITKLKLLENLCGELSIEGLHKVQSPVHAMEAHLFQKRLTKLVLKWSNVFDSARSGTLEKDVLNGLKPNCDTLKEFEIRSYGGVELPNWVGDPSFLLLTDVSIVDCRNCTSLPPLGSLLLLKKLLIKGMHEIKVIGLELGGAVVIAFPTLEILIFEDMSGWEYWSNKGTTSDTSFPCLQELQIKNCPNLIDASLEAMPSLRVLQIGGCGHGVLRSLVQTAPTIAELAIESISGLTDEVWRGVIQYLGAVEEVSIKECNEMGYLWESEAEGSSALVNLRKLEVFGCSNLVSLGEKEAYDDSGTKFSYLRNLEVWFCGSMKRCSCPDKIERLTISSCSSLTHVSFPTGGQALKSLSIYGCHKLMERIDNTSMPMLESVDIRRWSNLKSISELNIGGFLTSLVIQDCQSLESFPGLLLLQLTQLTIADCQSLVSFPDLQLSKCKSLKHLEITNCPSIDASFPRGIWPPELCSLEIGGLQKPISEWGFQNFPTSLVCLKLHGEHVRDFSQLSYLLPSSLTELHIQEFDELESSLMGLEHLTCLQHLSIFDCPKMKILPDLLLPSLLTLEIFDCPNLKRRCNGRGSHYWPLISHIPRIDIQDGYSFIN